MRPLLLFAALLLAACAAVPNRPQDRPTTATPPQATAQSAPAGTAPAGPAQAAAPAPQRDNRLTFYLGQRQLDEDDYAPVDQQALFGLEFTHEKADSAVGFELGLMGSADSATLLGVDVTASTGEVYGGVRKTFGSGSVRPYIGGGLAYVTEVFDVTVVDESDGSIAGYAHGGVNFDVTPGFFLGFDVRGLFGSDITLFGFDTDADYLQFALTLGASF